MTVKQNSEGILVIVSGLSWHKGELQSLWVENANGASVQKNKRIIGN